MKQVLSGRTKVFTKKTLKAYFAEPSFSWNKNVQIQYWLKRHKKLSWNTNLAIGDYAIGTTALLRH